VIGLGIAIPANFTGNANSSRETSDGNVYFGRERWEEMLLECFLDRDEKTADLWYILGAKIAIRFADISGVPRTSIEGIFRLLGRDL
jgi:hypothetical protein